MTSETFLSSKELGFVRAKGDETTGGEFVVERRGMSADFNELERIRDFIIKKNNTVESLKTILTRLKSIKNHFVLN